MTTAPDRRSTLRVVRTPALRRPGRGRTRLAWSRFRYHGIDADSVVAAALDLVWAAAPGLTGERQGHSAGKARRLGLVDHGSGGGLPADRRAEVEGRRGVQADREPVGTFRPVVEHPGVEHRAPGREDG